MTLGTSDRPIDILLVEDNPGDARLTQELIEGSGYAANVSVVEDGETALAYMRREGEYSEASRPHLVLLDLNLPKMGGIEVLENMNGDDDLNSIAVFVLTGTQAEASLLTSYNVPPSRFFQKPVEAVRFKNAVKMAQSSTNLPPIGPKPAPEPGPEEMEAEAKGSKKWWWPFGS